MGVHVASEVYTFELSGRQARGANGRQDTLARRGFPSLCMAGSASPSIEGLPAPGLSCSVTQALHREQRQVVGRRSVSCKRIDAMLDPVKQG